MMRAWILERIKDIDSNRSLLKQVDMPKPSPGETDLLIRISVCGICHTELDEIEGRTPPLIFPMILGHQIVGIVEEKGSKVTQIQEGQRVGIGWYHHSCGECDFCKTGFQNLCSEYHATGRDVPGGYAEYVTVPETSAFPIPEIFDDHEAAPLLCAGAIGYRSVHLTGMKDGNVLGLTGFGASGHLVLKLVRYLYPNSSVQVFARNKKEREFALELGASWAGDTQEKSPLLNHAIIDTTPVWQPVIKALENLRPGGRLVINAIRKQANDKDSLMALDYASHLWMEKEIKSVANVAPSDIEMFLKLASEIPIIPEVQCYPFADVNHALSELKDGIIRGAKVLCVAKDKVK